MASHRTPLAVFFLTVVQTVALGQSTNHIYGHDIGLPFEYCVVGAPLTATRTLDYEPAKNSVDSVPVHRDATLYRDSEGRTRTEFNHPGQLLSVFVQDCVAGLYYCWRVGDTAAIRWKIRQVGHTYDTATAPKLDNGKDTVVIEGVPTHHSYRTIKETEGKIEQWDERWYAPSLDLDLVFVFYDVDEGKTTSRILNLNRAEPDAALFQVPEGMTMKEDGSPHPAKSQ